MSDAVGFNKRQYRERMHSDSAMHCEAPLPGEANVKRHGDPLRMDILVSSVHARTDELRRRFADARMNPVHPEQQRGRIERDV